MNTDMGNETTAGGFRFIDASVRIVRTEVVRRSLIFAFPPSIPESDVEAIANLLICERAEGVDVSRNEAEGYIPDDAATDGFLRLQVLPNGEEKLVDVVLEPTIDGKLRVKRQPYLDTIFDAATQELL